MWALLAEAAAVDGVPSWITAVGGGTATAILGWYAWYTATKTVPNLVKDFRDEMAVNRAACASEKKDHLDAFRAELREERQHRTDGERCMAAAIDKLSDTIRDIKSP